MEMVFTDTINRVARAIHPAAWNADGVDWGPDEQAKAQQAALYMATNALRALQVYDVHLVNVLRRRNIQFEAWASVIHDLGSHRG